MTGSGTLSILSAADFLRLIRGGAWLVLTKRQGLAPPLPPLPAMAERTLAELGFGDIWPEFHQTMVAFLGLGPVKPPDLALKAASYAEGLRDQWLSVSREIVFYTSGSTGEPKPSPHPETLLRQEGSETGKLFQGVNRVVVTVPLLHSYGFIFGLMLPKTLQVPVVDVPPLPTVLAETLKEGDLVVGFPLIFSRLEIPAVSTVQFLSSTAPCPDDAFRSILSKGITRLTEIYGASETGAMAVRFAPGPFQLLSYWRQEGGRQLARRLPDGSEKKYPLPDHLLWSDSRRFVPAGRIDQAVQVAGVNVYPGRVAAVIEEHPGVSECAVRLMNTVEGFRLKAFIVPRQGGSEAVLRRELNQLLRDRLSPPERPGHLAFGSRLPLSLAGKPADWAI